MMNNISVADLLDNLRENFLEDLPLRVNLIEDEVMASQNADSYDELFRMVHSLKGSAGSYNYHEITKIAHSMEDVMLSLMQKNEFGTSSTANVLLKFIDVFRDTIPTLKDGKSAPLDLDEQLALLRGEIFVENIDILVVEPSKLYASMIEYSLDGLAVNINFIQDGFQALDKLLLTKYDLLITSLESSRLNGDALVAALRLLHNFNKSIKVVLITSRAIDKIANKDDFDEILDRKTVKDGGLKAVVKGLLE